MMSGSLAMSRALRERNEPGFAGIEALEVVEIYREVGTS
jgi:hypothetical protein